MFSPIFGENIFKIIASDPSSRFFQTGVLSFLIRDWRNLHFATSGIILPQLLLAPVTRESIRWLYTGSG
jgi:hypothetical protein